MAAVSVIYPRNDDAVFDYTYYTVMHLPLLRERWGGAGLVGIEALRGLPGADDTQSPYMLIAILRFETVEQANAAMSSPHMAEIAEDVAKFSNVAPIIQINDELG